MDKGYVVTMSLISHPYGDSSAPYLGTALPQKLRPRKRLCGYRNIRTVR